jgi:hypothetical protein
MVHFALVVAAALFLFCVACGALLFVINMFKIHWLLGIAGVAGTVIGTCILLTFI